MKKVINGLILCYEEIQTYLYNTQLLFATHLFYKSFQFLGRTQVIALDMFKALHKIS